MNTKTTVKVAIALLSSVVLFAPTAALAGRFTDQVRSQLIQAAAALGLTGYQLSHNPYINRLGDNSSSPIVLNLRGGTSYAMVGVCDEDCSDIDLEIYDSNGNLVDSDTTGNDTPVVTVTPRWTDRFYIKVNMASCSTSPCYYGVGVFGR